MDPGLFPLVWSPDLEFMRLGIVSWYTFFPVSAPSPVMDPGDQKLSIESSQFQSLRRGFVTLQSQFKARWSGVRLRKGGEGWGFY